MAAKTQTPNPTVQPERVSLQEDPDVLGVAWENTSRNGRKYLRVDLKCDLKKGEPVVAFAMRNGYVLRKGRPANGSIFA